MAGEMVQNYTAMLRAALSARLHPSCSLRLALIVSTMQTLQASRYVVPSQTFLVSTIMCLSPVNCCRIFAGSLRAAPQARQVRTSLWVTTHPRWIRSYATQPHVMENLSPTPRRFRPFRLKRFREGRVSCAVALFAHCRRFLRAGLGGSSSSSCCRDIRGMQPVTINISAHPTAAQVLVSLSEPCPPQRASPAADYMGSAATSICIRQVGNQNSMGETTHSG